MPDIENDLLDETEEQDLYVYKDQSFESLKELNDWYEDYRKDILQWSSQLKSPYNLKKALETGTALIVDDHNIAFAAIPAELVTKEDIESFLQELQPHDTVWAIQHFLEDYYNKRNKKVAYSFYKSAKENRRYIVIGDIHGAYNELKRLWLNLKPTHIDKVIFLGDLVDKGPHSEEVVTFVRLKKEAGFNITLIEGNHEEKLIRLYRKGKPTEADVSLESIEFLETAIPYYTFTSGGKRFSCVHGGFYPAFKNEYKKDLMGNKEIDSFYGNYRYQGSKENYKQLKELERLLGLMQEEYKNLNNIPKPERSLDQKHSLKSLFRQIDALKISIGDLKKDGELSKEDKEHIKSIQRFFMTRYVDEKGHLISTDPVTLQPTKKGPYWAKVYEGEHGIAFFGHEPFDDVQVFHNEEQGPVAYGIDTGAVFGGKLTAAVVEQGQVSFINVKSERAYAKKHFASLKTSEILENHHVDIPSYLIGVFTLIKTVAKEAYLVGGAVRDLMLGLQPKDFDIVTSADPEVLMPLFVKNGWTIKEAGTDFKVLHVGKNGINLEIARFRKDTHPDSNQTVVEHGTPYDDATRRDLTINALYLNPWTGELVDPSGEALPTFKAKQIKFMGDPDKRIDEDHSRILRFYRFIDKFKKQGFEVNQQSLSKVRSNFFKVQRLDHNRIREELEKLIGLNKLEQKLEALSNPNQHLLRLETYDKALKDDPSRVFKFLKMLTRLKDYGWLPDTGSLRSIRKNIELLKKMDPDSFMQEMEMLAGVLPDVAADKLEDQIKVISEEIEFLLKKPRTVEREREVGTLKGKADSILRDYQGL